MAFYFCPAYDLAVAQIPRCGNTSIGEWLGHADLVENDDSKLLNVSNRVAFIRNPIERFKSAYSFLKWMGHHNQSGEEYVDNALDPKAVDDEHYRLQTSFIGGMANRYHRFENILKVYELYKPGVFPHNNSATRLPTPYYRLPELTEKFERDFILWESIT